MSTSPAPATKPGYRTFLCARDSKDNVLLSVRHPGKKELEAADLEFSGTFNRSLLHGLPTQAKMLRELRENEVISPKDEQEIGQLTADLRAAEAKVRALDDGEDKTKAQDALAVVQRKLNARNREIESMLAHTADTKANEAQRNVLIACVTEYADGANMGKRLWDTIDSLLEENDAALLNRVLYEYMMCQADLPSEWDSITKEDAPAATDVNTEKKDGNPAVTDAANAAAPVVEAPVA